MLSRCGYFIFALAAILFSTACVIVPVPVRMPAEVKGPVGASADLTFIVPQHTKKDEGVRRLAWADVGLDDSRLFWAHWELSTKGTSWAGISPAGAGEYGRTRVWTAHNILIDFDSNGVVTSAREVENRDLMNELVSWIHAPGRTLPDTSMLTRRSFTAGYHYNKRTQAPSRWGTVFIQQLGLEFNREKTGLRFHVAYDRIANIELDPISLIPTTIIWVGKIKTYSTENRRPRLKLRLKDKTAWGTEVYVLVDPPLFLAALKAITLQGNTGRYHQTGKDSATQQSNQEPSAASKSPIVDQSNLEQAGVRLGWLARCCDDHWASRQKTPSAVS